jgi:hypothetical protein
MRHSFGDWALALTAYNMGPTRLRALLAAGQQPAFRYAAAVLTRYRELSAGGLVEGDAARLAAGTR